MAKVKQRSKCPELNPLKIAKLIILDEEYPNFIGRNRHESIIVFIKHKCMLGSNAIATSYFFYASTEYRTLLNSTSSRRGDRRVHAIYMFPLYPPLITYNGDKPYARRSSKRRYSEQISELESSQSRYFRLRCHMSREFKISICSRNMIQNPGDRIEGQRETLKYTYGAPITAAAAPITVLACQSRVHALSHCLIGGCSDNASMLRCWSD